MLELEKRILDAYRDGTHLSYMQECFFISEEEIKAVLINYKKRNRYQRTFTDEFKKLIAERDINDIPRRQIALELGISINTVKRACEQFGQTVKEKTSSDNAYTIIEDVHNLDRCPKCKSMRVNEIESMAGNVNTTGIFCMECGEEHFIMDGKIYRVNWEYIN